MEKIYIFLHVTRMYVHVYSLAENNAWKVGLWVIFNFFIRLIVFQITFSCFLYNEHKLIIFLKKSFWICQGTQPVYISPEIFLYCELFSHFMSGFLFIFALLFSNLLLDRSNIPLVWQLSILFLFFW